MDKDTVSLLTSPSKTAFRSFSRALQTPPSLHNLIRPLAGLAVVFFFAAITIIGLFLRPQWQNIILMTQLVLLVAGLLIIVLLIRRLYREVLQPMDSLQSWASRMRQGDYSAEIKPRSEADELGVALANMTLQLRETTAENQRENWFKTGISELNDRMRGEQSIEDLSDNIQALKQLVRGLRQGEAGED